jgi:hypothetical protein
MMGLRSSHLSGQRKAPTRLTTSSRKPAFRDDAGVEYAALLESELADARANKASLEQRAIALVSTSGVLVTALFGLVAFLTNSETFRLPHDAKPPLYVALGLFAFAGLMALMVNKPNRRYLGLKPPTLAAPSRWRLWTGRRRRHQALTDMRRVGFDEVIRGYRWGSPPPIARRRVALTRYTIYCAYQGANDRKARVLSVAFLAEALAVLSLAVSVALILNS